MPSTFTELAPTKVNLYLHVLRQRDDGYHDLDSLMAFSDFGDVVTLEQNKPLKLEINGPYATHFTAEEISVERGSKNILAKILWALADYTNQTPNFTISLTKNIPMGAGLGGGSADAAALARILCDLWDIDKEGAALNDILFNIGADVPVCFHGQSCRIKDAGENIDQFIGLPNLHAVLVHPIEHCSTAKIFSDLRIDKKEALSTPKHFENTDSLLAFLKNTDNDLKTCAIKNCAVIQTALNTLNNNEGLLHCNMSGSGSACYGLFTDEITAQNASKAIKNLHPTWWVQAVTLGSNKTTG